MELEITGVNEHKGFQLSEPKIFNTDLIVLTGKNGSGKTRFLESLQNNSSTAAFDRTPINNNEITFIQQSQLTPNLGSRYNDSEAERKIISTLERYDKIKNDLDMPFDEQKASLHMNHGRGSVDIRDYRASSLSYKDLYILSNKIAKDLGCAPSALTHNDIKLNFQEPQHNILGIQYFSTIVNGYIKGKKQNEFNQYKVEKKGEDVKFWSDSEFIEKFGERPWIIMDSILNDVFHGKFTFDIPDESSESNSYQAVLKQSDNGLPMDVNSISSGEKTLLWLALTLFNSQYYDSELVTTPKLLLLDEPDAFLHPKMVSNMYKVLESFQKKFNSIILLTTHSPTTVALAPENSVFVVSDNTIFPVSKDEGITELLDGITQISINPENRRQVFVESQYDADIYQAIYGKLAGNSRIDPKISLNFVSSGPKMPEQQLKDKAKQILKIDNDEQLREFVEAVNGIGSCSHVEGAVESLRANGNTTAKGIIDWDTKNTSKDHVIVFAENDAYSIENVALDPICILLLLHIDQPDKFTMTEICGENINWSQWLENDSLLQVSIDKFLLKILEKENQKNYELHYISSEKRLLSDADYLMMKGHELEELIKKAYPRLNAFTRTGKDGELKYEVVSKAMITLTNGKFIPQVFEHVLSEVQK